MAFSEDDDDFTRLHYIPTGDPFKIVFTCLFDHIIFKCLETVLIWLPLPTDPVPYLSAFLSTCKY